MCVCLSVYVCVCVCVCVYSASGPGAVHDQGMRGRSERVPGDQSDALIWSDWTVIYNVCLGDGPFRPAGQGVREGLLHIRNI